jgi:hypothetical protein
VLTNMKILRLIFLMIAGSVLILAAAGCNLDDEFFNPDISAPAETTAGNIATAEETIYAIRRHLAAQLEVGIDQISVYYTRAVSWPDTSLGFPEEGKQYATILVEGHQHLLRAGGYLYEYHTDRAGNFVFCGAAPEQEVEMPEDSSVQDGWPNEPAGTDVIITRTFKPTADSSFQDGWPNQPVENDVVVTITTK